MTPRCLQTRRGVVTFPAYIPVTTFGEKYPLDRLLRPYLPRLAQAMMVSYQYAPRHLEEIPPLPVWDYQKAQGLPLWLDSGGYAALFANARVIENHGLGIIEIEKEDGQRETIHPSMVITLQERIADVAFTLDFPIHPGMDQHEAERRQDLTIKNALWALSNRRARNLPLYACVQGWDLASFKACVQAYKGFDGIAIGGLARRTQDVPALLAIVEAVRGEIGDVPLHVLGIGDPKLVQAVFQAGADSVDSSSYVQLAANGQLWGCPTRLEQLSPTERVHVALCNLASATQQALPLSLARLVFRTSTLFAAEVENKGSV